jgi:hypothetical protein
MKHSGSGGFLIFLRQRKINQNKNMGLLGLT